jgi:hypothetical protein
MRTSAKLGLAALVAALLLASAISTASARNFSFSEGSFTVSFSSLEFTGGATIRCRTTLEGSFHSRTIAKVAGAPIGSYTRGIIAHPCTGGEVWLDDGSSTQPLGTAAMKLPFDTQYNGFAGPLPTVSSVTLPIARASFVIQATILGLTCRGRYGRPEDSISTVAAREAGGGITSLAVNGRGSLVEELGPNRVCPASARLVGTGAVKKLGTGAEISITLI